MARPIVTLLTDFGTVDGFVGAMKGVILSRAPDAQVVDLTHDIPPQDVRAGAWALREAAPMFPVGTIHVAVVDPGVGTARRPLLVRGGGQLLVGPDNGVLSLAASRGGGEQPQGAPARGAAATHNLQAECWVLDRSAFYRSGEEVSDTFHGRDIFASVAGHLAAGVAPQACGSPTAAWQRMEEPEAERRSSEVRGAVIHVDRFGNLVTNIGRALLELDPPARRRVEVGGRAVGPLRRTFADVAVGEWVAYLGSGGTLEVAVRDGDAAGTLGAGPGTEVRVC